ncbi:hypothetical protein QQF64_028293 [Cirrhinus molitorella]|uniref:Uncharacterized protein n=1 Tax=Cirrhinus molitorella TaxID=172907 RepID=A0ABR3N6J3_9TELE
MRHECTSRNVILTTGVLCETHSTDCLHAFIHSSISESSLHAVVARGHQLFQSISCRWLQKTLNVEFTSVNIVNTRGTRADADEMRLNVWH